ncbi:hypothetical protein A3A55_04570 [Candidatus Roizmanbacteria bacterium RIFCSPLOWO2_01_FULL_40_14]|uniref:Uncharacterized protein n=2 Tax=Candidatus Roizmaniibacteriota TaxID=1752723 RepID=A0A0G0VHK1_9BACT|nr:MAG: hypothetical protein UU14_C0026G0020 [Candidatus Roizmanbacteria bacterium GW2011_GWB1_40_7]KKR93325.1 MAG: hypothetical protein UU41_C0020G0015 [Candidatus Roizmanbacteria bacterium GW2011_GWA1_41_13]OGK50788.1 MAG: hypothetical protein A3A55_04570 [Candidatus Roizmanbacteria bacterium RIFCSPLOWO2_01_FULL_40_14]
MSETLSPEPSAAVTTAAPTETFSQGTDLFVPTPFESSIISPPEALSPAIDFSGGSFIGNDKASAFTGTTTPVPEIGPLPAPYETIVFQEGPEMPAPNPLTSTISPLLPKVGSFTEPLDKSYELPFFNTASKRTEKHVPDEVYEEIPPGELPSPQEAVAAALSLLGFFNNEDPHQSEINSSIDDSFDMPKLLEGIEELLDETYNQQQQQAILDQTIEQTVQTPALQDLPAEFINPIAQTEHDTVAEILEEASVSETVVIEQEPALSPEIEHAVKYVAANATHAKQTLLALKEINYPEPETVLEQILTSQLENVELEVQTDPQISGKEYVALEEQVSFVLRNKNSKDMDIVVIEWVRDDEALHERENAFSNATNRAYKHNKEVNGSVVLKYYGPTKYQKSEPLQDSSREDNSLTETVREVRNMRPALKKEEMLNKISKTTAEKPPVRLAVKGKSVTDKDVERVFKEPAFDLKVLIKQIIG